MIRLLERDLFWKMPPDVEMEVGPSTIEDLPLVHRRNREVLKTGRSSTSTGRSQRRYQELLGGIPFPILRNPTRIQAPSRFVVRLYTSSRGWYAGESAQNLHPGCDGQYQVSKACLYVPSACSQH
jgi:hypothetical protein